MDDGGPTASIILFIVLVLIEMLFYGFGSAIQFLNRNDIEKRAEEEKDIKSIRLYQMLEKPTQFINTVQLVATLINIIIGGFYLGIWLVRIRDFIQMTAVANFKPLTALSMGSIQIISLVLSTVVLLYIVLTLGVLVPKKAVARNPELWAYAFVTPIYAVTKILSPITGIVTHTANGILRIFGIKPEEDGTGCRRG